MLPIFVVGVGRSGTTLLQALLSSHPEIGGLPETGFFRRYCLDRTLEQMAQENRREEILATLQNDHRFMRVDGALNFVESFFESSHEFSSRQLFKFILNGIALKQNTSFVCDKDPRLVEYLPQLAQVFGEDARIVHIVRDPRAVLASKKKAEWSKDRSLLWHLTANRSQFLAGHMEGPKLFGTKYREICYEKLTADPEGELRQLTSWLSVPFDGAMLMHTESVNDLVSSEEKQWKGNVYKPVDPGLNEKWKKELSPREIRSAESVSKPAMELCGYSRAVIPNLSTADKIAVLIISVVVRVGRIIRRIQRRLIR